MEKKQAIYSNLYTTCKVIPLTKFIDVYCGDLEALVIEGESDKEALEAASSKIVAEYVKIIGGENMFELTRQNDLINKQIKVTVLEAAKGLLSMRAYTEAVNALASVNMKAEVPDTVEEVKALNGRIDSELANLKRILLSEAKKAESKQEQKVDRSHFMRELAMANAHFKFCIDPNQYTAESYAYLIKQMNNDFKRMKEWQTRKR